MQILSSFRADALICVAQKQALDTMLLSFAPKVFSSLAVLGGFRSTLQLMVPFILEQTPDRASHTKQIIIHLPDTDQARRERPFSFMAGIP